MSEKDYNDLSENERNIEVYDQLIPINNPIDKNNIVDESWQNNKYIDKIYALIVRLQEYCKQNSLPIFNKSDTNTIIMNAFID
jgi:hypothetical protein